MDKKAQWSLVAAAWVLAIGVLALGLYALHRFSPDDSKTAAPPVPQPGIATKVFCPVDHVEVVVGPTTPKVNYNGNTYYFCDTKDSQGRSHKELFLMDPQLYLTGQSSYAPVQTPAAATPAPGVAPSATLTPPSASDTGGPSYSRAATPGPPATPLASPTPLAQGH
jgi:YHS domain-containing protein